MTRWPNTDRQNAVLTATLLCLSVAMAAGAGEGLPDMGVPFNGMTTCAVVEDGRTFDLDVFSIAAWVRMRQTDSSQVFVNRGVAGGLFTLYLYQGNIRMLVEFEDGRYTHAHCPVSTADRWVHYLGTYDGSQIQLFVDGTLVAATKAVGRMPRSDASLYLGALGPHVRVLDGELEDVRIWNRALSAREATRVVRAEAGGPLDTGLLARWKSEDLEDSIWHGAFAGAPAATYSEDVALAVQEVDGYRGIWYSNQRQDDEYVFKYSGGLGTYCMKHLPFAVYAPEVNRTFFVYGGTTTAGDTLLHMISYFDHATQTVPRPRLLIDKMTSDAHDNPVISLDSDGHLWVFSSSHGTARPSYIFMSKEPYDIDAFERVLTTNFSYPQPHFIPDKGFVFLHTLYRDGGRSLFQSVSPDGRQWSEPELISRIERGHYQVSATHGTKVGTAFNMHPAPQGLNWRTNLYYMETDDCGRTWRTVAGEPLAMPVTDIASPALVYDYQSDGIVVYMKEVVFDPEGRPVIFFLTSKGWQSGPVNDPRHWQTARWTGQRWEINEVVRVDNNYDSGSLYIEGDDLWRVIGPGGPGPQPYNTGGEMEMWISRDRGRTWHKSAELTRDSRFNHHYARRVVNAHPDFYALWADGHGREKSTSRLYFTDRDGTCVWRLPEWMDGPMVAPELAW